MFIYVFYVKILKTNLNKTIFALNIKIKVLFTMTTEKFEIEINTLCFKFSIVLLNKVVKEESFDANKELKAFLNI